MHSSSLSILCKLIWGCKFMTIWMYLPLKMFTLGICFINFTMYMIILCLQSIFNNFCVDKLNYFQRKAFLLSRLIYIMDKIFTIFNLGFPGGSDDKEATCNAGDLWYHEQWNCSEVQRKYRAWKCCVCIGIWSICQRTAARRSWTDLEKSWPLMKGSVPSGFFR